MSKNVEFSDLLGKTLIEIEKNDDNIIFYTSDGLVYKQYHNQDWSENVFIEDIVGDLNDLLFAPILQAEESSSDDEKVRDGTGAWTFYKLATVGGYVTIKWYGRSNDHYSVSVSFAKIKESSKLAK